MATRQYRPVTNEYLQDQADAWHAVVEALNRAYPQWYNLAPRGMDAAVKAINELGDARRDLALWHQQAEAKKEGPL